VRRLILAVTLAVAALVAAAAAAAAPIGPPVTDPNGIINLPSGYSYTLLADSCSDSVRSTESGLTFPMPDDFDANFAFNAPGGETWLLSGHELTEPRPGDFQGDAGKCAVDEQATVDDGDSDGTGSISRLLLGRDGTTVLDRQLITTGLHDLCAGAVTPWNTILVNEEFPFIVDPELRSGWVWEIDPATGAQTKLTGMGRFSHEQEAYANGAWYLTDDRGDARFLYKFVPDRHSDLTAGSLYGLAFSKATMTGTWIGPLNPNDPDTDMRSRGYQPATWGFVKHEGIVASASSTGMGGNEVTMSESSAGSDPGRIWTFQDRGGVVYGSILVEGDWARLSRPDNLRYTDAGDLLLMEDHSSGDFRANPATGGINQIWLLPRNRSGSENMLLFANLPGGAEPTGPWFSNDNRLLYLSIQDQPRAGAGTSRLIAIQAPGSFNQPYDR
jgi:secreted PhoX family phosphatase